MSKDVQSSIERQNALTNATQLVIAVFSRIPDENLKGLKSDQIAKMAAKLVHDVTRMHLKFHNEEE